MRGYIPYAKPTDASIRNHYNVGYADGSPPEPIRDIPSIIDPANGYASLRNSNSPLQECLLSLLCCGIDLVVSYMVPVEGAPAETGFYKHPQGVPGNRVAFTGTFVPLSSE